VPNQEKVINQVIRVTYHDNAGYVRMILLPIRELMQAHFALAEDNSLRTLAKQEWESHGHQNGTILEMGGPGSPLGDFQLPGPASSRPVSFKDGPRNPASFAEKPGHSTR
jgi:hypothetical protein